MNNIITNETWIEFQERCVWHHESDMIRTDVCTKGIHGQFTCSKDYCPRIKLPVVKEEKI